MKSKKIIKIINFLIIGLGKMGMAHLESLLKERLFFYLIEKNIYRKNIKKN